MRQIQDWLALCIDLVEDVITEQLQDVATPLLIPLAVMLVLRAFVEEVEFSEEAHKARIFELTGQVRVELVVKVEGGIKRGDDFESNASKKSIDAFDLVCGTMVEKPRDTIAKIRRKRAVKDLGGFRWVGRREIVGCYGEDEATELVKI